MTNLATLKLQAQAALRDAADAWLFVEERIQNGRIYCQGHPGDQRAARLLAHLEGQTAGLEHTFWCANATMKGLYDNSG